MNVRPPEPVSEEFLKIQDAYLSAERDRAGVVDAEALPHLRSDSRLVLWQGDITTLKADAIVNAANSAMLGCFIRFTAASTISYTLAAEFSCD